jgi:BMFP domain-containing protein YqiC
MLSGVLYLYDSTDTTTAHDGVTCLVSDDDRRYKPVAGAFAVHDAVNSGVSTALTIRHNNQLLRSTSSLAYKKDMEPLESRYADAILNIEPIWYRSRAKADNPEWSWYGAAAEQVAEIDARLVSWGYLDEDIEKVPIYVTRQEPETESVEVEETEIAIDDNGNAIARKITKTIQKQRVSLHHVFNEDGTPHMVDGPNKTKVHAVIAKPVTRAVEHLDRYERRPKDGAVKKPDGVAYERLTVLLLDIVKRDRVRLAALEARIAALEGKDHLGRVTSSDAKS